MSCEILVPTNWWSTPQNFPCISMNIHGAALVTYSEQVSSWPGVMGQLFSSGAKNGGNFDISTPDNQLYIWPECALNANGNFIVAWVTTALGITVSYNNGGNVSIGSGWKPAVAIDDDNDYIVVWEEDGQLSGYSSGPLTSGTFELGVSGEIGLSPDIAMDADGNFGVTWEDGTDCYVKLFDKNLIGLAGPTKVNTTASATHARIGMSRTTGEFVVSWEYGSNVYAQAFDADGSTYESVFTAANFGSSWPDTYIYMHDIAMDTAGTILCAYEHKDAIGSRVYGSFFSRTGMLLDNFLAACYRGPTYTPKAAAGSTGEFAITWWDYRNQCACGKSDVFVRFFSVGVPVTGTGEGGGGGGSVFVKLADYIKFLPPDLVSRK